jgi:hypothetical protein
MASRQDVMFYGMNAPDEIPEWFKAPDELPIPEEPKLPRELENRITDDWVKGGRTHDLRKAYRHNRAMEGREDVIALAEEYEKKWREYEKALVDIPIQNLKRRYFGWRYYYGKIMSEYEPGKDIE